jgi:hypothetical protein
MKKIKKLYNIKNKIMTKEKTNLKNIAVLYCGCSLNYIELQTS